MTPMWWRDACQPLDSAAMDQARARQQKLTKPAGSLGQLEGLAVRLAGLQGRERPSLERVAITIFAGDHGVVEEGISAYPQAVTGQMLRNFVGGGAAISVLARELDAELQVVDLGTIDANLELPGVHHLRLGAGTANFARQPAMTEGQLAAALQAGRDSALRAIDKGAQLFIGGEMGIGNTTAAAALASTLLGGHGQDNAQRMAELPHTHVMLALLRDGFHPDSPGGQVELRGDGSPVLDYPVTDYLRDGLRRAWHSMAQIQFAAGARQVMPVHGDARYVSTPAQAQALIDGLTLELLRMRLGSAHVMGGCALGEDPRQAVCDSLGRHHQLENLSIHDGSLFPTSIGANPQLSVYALAALLSEALVGRLARGT